jgi:pilus assembly protein CpaB
MNTARIVVLTIAIGAGGIAADPASGSDNKPAAPAESAAQLQTVDVLAAKSDLGLDQAEAIKPTNAAKSSTSSGTAGVVSPQMMQK